MTERNVVSIDIGMYNLGLVCARVHEDLTIYVDRVAKVDLAHSMHRRIPAILCKLHHSNATCDRVAHFIQEWEPWLNGATDILIERQPPTGFKDIEALLQYCFRDKVHIIQPQSIHSHFGLPHGDYEGRKAITVAIAHHHLKGVPGWMGLERKHDVADAMCQLLWWTSQLPRPKRPIERLPFEEYKLNPNVSPFSS